MTRQDAISEAGGGPDPVMLPDVRKSVAVAAPVEQAFRIYVEYPAEWLPPGHTFLRDPAAIIIEPFAGGRYYERGADGTEVTRGTVLEFEAPHRLVMTWRVGPGWRPVFDDDQASRTVLDFTAAGPDSAVLTLTYTDLHRHGDFAPQLLAAISGPDLGTLARYADVVARHAAAGQP